MQDRVQAAICTRSFAVFASQDDTRVERGCLLMFSDGLPEAVAGGLPIGYERVEQIARSRMSVDAILDEISAVPSIVIDDDVTLLTIERLRA